MYQIGDMVAYASTGVCTVTDIREEKFGGVTRMYYILTPVGSTSVVYVPTDNEQLLAKMRPLSTRDEVHDVISSIRREEAPAWIDDNHRRSIYFQEVLGGGDLLELMRLTRSIRSRREALAERGKRNLMADENVNKRAERILFGEIAEVVGIRIDEVEAYIVDLLATAQ